MNNVDMSNCSICLDSHAEPLSIIRCGHAFGKKCIATWFETQKPQIPTCPMCRQDARSLRQRLVDFITPTPLIRAIGIGGCVGAISTMMTATVVGGSVNTVVTVGALSLAGAAVNVRKNYFATAVVSASAGIIAGPEGILSVAAGMLGATLGIAIVNRTVQRYVVSQALILAGVDLIYLARSIMYSAQSVSNE